MHSMTLYGIIPLARVCRYKRYFLYRHTNKERKDIKQFEQIYIR